MYYHFTHTMHTYTTYHAYTHSYTIYYYVYVYLYIIIPITLQTHTVIQTYCTYSLQDKNVYVSAMTHRQQQSNTQHQYPYINITYKFITVKTVRDLYRHRLIVLILLYELIPTNYYLHTHYHLIICTTSNTFLSTYFKDVYIYIYTHEYMEQHVLSFHTYHAYIYLISCIHSRIQYLLPSITMYTCTCIVLYQLHYKHIRLYRHIVLTYCKIRMCMFPQ